MKTLKKLHLSVVVCIFLFACTDDRPANNLDDSTHNHEGYDHNMEGIEDNFPFVAPTHVKSGNKILDAFAVKFVLGSYKTKLWYIYVYNDDTTELAIGYKISNTIPPDVEGYSWKELVEQRNEKQIIRSKRHRNQFMSKRRRIVSQVIIVPSRKDGNQYSIDDLYVHLFTDKNKISPEEYFNMNYKLEIESKTLHKGTIHFPGLGGGG
ncbi:hypothetical protein [Ekhidna sp.]